MAKTKKPAAAPVASTSEFADKAGVVLAVGDQVRYEVLTSPNNGREAIITAIHQRETDVVATVEFVYDSHWQAAPAAPAFSENLVFLSRPAFAVGEQARVQWKSGKSYSDSGEAYTGRVGRVVSIFPNPPFPDLVKLAFPEGDLEDCEFQASDLLRTALAEPEAFDPYKLPHFTEVRAEQDAAAAAAAEPTRVLDAKGNHLLEFDAVQVVPAHRKSLGIGSRTGFVQDFVFAAGKETEARVTFPGTKGSTQRDFALIVSILERQMPAESSTPATASEPAVEAAPAQVANEQPAEPERLSVLAMVQEIPLADIDTSRNYRQVFDEADLAELAASIEAHGVMQPVLVRPSHAGPAAKPYQLVYGGRRYKASALAGLTTIPATVRELSDLAFAEMQLIENVQRKDVRPSDEARAFNDLLTKHGKSPEELSHQVGRPVKFVLQRAKLIALLPFWMQLLEANRLPLVAAHELARLPADGQAVVKKWMQAFRSYELNQTGPLDASSIRHAINQDVLRQLGTAAFPKEDATLFPKAGPCTTCPKNSANCRGLFDDLAEAGKPASCLDALCFTTKKELFVERRKVELGSSAVLVSESYDSPPAGAIGYKLYSRAKEGEKGAVLALQVDGSEAGTTRWVTLREAATNAAEVKAKEKAEQEARLRKERLTKTHRTLIAEKLTADLPAAVATQGPVYESILTWLLLEECGTAKNTLAYLGDSWDWEPSEADIRNDYSDKDERGFRPWHRFVLRMIGPMSLKQRMEMYMALKVRHRMDYDYEDRQFTIAKLVNGLGYPELEAEAEQAIVARYYTKKTKGAKA